MIIGISGKATSGKDTVAKLLQVVFHNRIMGLKDNDPALLNMLDAPGVMSALNNECGFPIQRFAGPLKRHVADLLGITVEKLESQEYKTKTLGGEWNYTKSYEAKCVHHSMTVRDLLIAIGNGAREYVHTDIWVNALLSTYQPGNDWIIPDVRYPNELKRIELYGFSIRVNRPGIKLINSISETGLDNATFDYTIKNTGTISDLFTNVIDILNDYEHSDTAVD